MPHWCAAVSKPFERKCYIGAQDIFPIFILFLFFFCLTFYSSFFSFFLGDADHQTASSHGNDGYIQKSTFDFLPSSSSGFASLKKCFDTRVKKNEWNKKEDGTTPLLQ